MCAACEVYVYVISEIYTEPLFTLDAFEFWIFKTNLAGEVIRHIHKEKQCSKEMEKIITQNWNLKEEEKFVNKEVNFQTNDTVSPTSTKKDRRYL